jgi:hypothetical protein
MARQKFVGEQIYFIKYGVDYVWTDSISSGMDAAVPFKSSQFFGRPISFS